MRSLFALALVVFALTGCKSTNDYLNDLDTMNPEPPSGVNFMVDRALVFDAGQLAHEAFAGLTTADEMSYWQVMRALSHGCEFLGKARQNPLLQADAATLIGTLASRYPIPPIDRQLEPVTSHEPSIEQLNLLLQAYKPLMIENGILGLESADQVVVLESERALEERTGQKLGRDPAAWRAWYEQKKDEYRAQFVADSRGPLEFFGSQRYRDASEARGVLRILSLWVEQWGYTDLADIFVPTIDCVARQACVNALAEAMARNKDGAVRAEVAEAMMLLRDPSFGEPLAAQLPLERNSYAAAKMIQALRFYPSRMTIEQIITAMALGDDQVLENAADVLRSLTGQEFGAERELWLNWWQESGEKMWR